MSMKLDFSTSLRDDVKSWWKQEIADFRSSYSTICDGLLEDINESLPYVSERLKKILDYNVAPAKFPQAGIATCIIYKILIPQEEGPCDRNLAFILGWCIIMIETTDLICDDIMDNSFKRFGKLCWFRLPEVGIEAINDSFILQHACYRLLRKYFSEFKSYEKIRKEFEEQMEKTYWGQFLDMKPIPRDQKVSLNLFTIEYYRLMAKHKTAFFKLPVITFMHLMAFTEEQICPVRVICDEVFYLFMLQNEYVDIYGSKFGYKLHTINCDIRNGKCTWFITKALEVCTEEEKLIIEENYGIEKEEAVQKIVDLYDSLTLYDKFLQAINEGCAKISKLIEQLDDVKLKNLLNFFLICIKEPRFLEEL